MKRRSFLIAAVGASVAAMLLPAVAHGWTAAPAGAWHCGEMFVNECWLARAWRAYGEYIWTVKWEYKPTGGSYEMKVTEEELVELGVTISQYMREPAPFFRLSPLVWP